MRDQNPLAYMLVTTLHSDIYVLGKSMLCVCVIIKAKAS